MEEWLESLEAMGRNARLASLAYVAGQQVEIPGEELNEALRRALVVRAVGGDPQRELELHEEAVTRLADELHDADRRERLQLALAGLSDLGGSRPGVAEALAELYANPDLAWSCFAAGLLAAEVG